ncbi:Protein CBR-klp-13 [Lobulomyces angularis]|nr:Protein CBR-klp-13 [Lobulomyces angularis]
MDEEKDKENRLLVAVRLRPISKKEMEKENVHICARVIDEHTILMTDPIDEYGDDVLRRDRQKERVYNYDYVFSEEVDQEELFHKTTKNLISSVIQGFNATAFAYGATGAGKTYTMLGTESNPGIMALTLRHLFEKVEVENADGNMEVNLSYMEIYNEQIRDLLSGKPEYLDLREDPHRGVIIPGITTFSAESAEDVLSFLHKGNKFRTCESTGANEVSSRSHAILQVVVSHKSVNLKGHRTERFGKLSMIDLAGSERAAETNNRGIRMIEGASINRSLLALANCINALGADGKRGKYVNYRDSKLTRLLKDSLGGNCRTVMIANISPASVHFDETHNTLKYASRARLIKTKLNQQITYKYAPQLQQAQSEYGDPKGYKTKSRPMTTSTATSTARRQPRALANISDDVNVSLDGINRSRNTAELEEFVSSLDILFKEHLDIQFKLVECELELNRNSLLLKKYQTDLFKLEKISSNESQYKNNKSFEINWEKIGVKVKFSIDQIKKIMKSLNSVKSKYWAQFSTTGDKINSLHQNIPKSFEKRAKQFLQLYIKAHYMKIENIATKANHNQSDITLNDKDSLIQTLLKQIQCSEQIKKCQHKLLNDNNIKIPLNLRTLYFEYDSIGFDEGHLKINSESSDNVTVSNDMINSEETLSASKESIVDAAPKDQNDESYERRSVPKRFSKSSYDLPQIIGSKKKGFNESGSRKEKGKEINLPELNRKVYNRTVNWNSRQKDSELENSREQTIDDADDDYYFKEKNKKCKRNRNYR